MKKEKIKNTEVFKEGDVTVYFKDSKNMDEIKDESVHLIVTSPPYYNFIEYGKIGVGIEKVYQHYLDNMELIFKECFRAIIPDGKVCMNISNMKSRKDVEGKSFVYPIVADMTKIMQKIGFVFFDELIWVKGSANAGALGGKPLFGSYPYPPNPKMLDSIFENILIFKKDGKLENRVDKESKEKSKVSMKEWMEYTKGVWSFDVDRGSEHPASFPMELPKRLIKIYSFKNEIVLDPFVGTGTTAITAALLGRKGIGYEIYPKYLKLIENKYKVQILQTRMFDDHIDQEEKKSSLKSKKSEIIEIF
jgi:DNA modification methylase